MLFVFATADTWPIWMKNTRIPLDVVWIGDDRSIVHMASLPAC